MWILWGKRGEGYICQRAGQGSAGGAGGFGQGMALCVPCALSNWLPMRLHGGGPWWGSATYASLLGKVVALRKALQEVRMVLQWCIGLLFTRLGGGSNVR